MRPNSCLKQRVQLDSGEGSLLDTWKSNNWRKNLTLFSEPLLDLSWWLCSWGEYCRAQTALSLPTCHMLGARCRSAIYRTEISVSFRVRIQYSLCELSTEYIFSSTLLFFFSYFHDRINLWWVFFPQDWPKVLFSKWVLKCDFITKYDSHGLFIKSVNIFD